MKKVQISREALMNIAGAGFAGSHGVATHSVPFTAQGNQRVYAIDIYTDGATFDVLDEDGQTVGLHRRTAGGDGYPAGSVITGSFTRITPASGHSAAYFIATSL